MPSVAAKSASGMRRRGWGPAPRCTCGAVARAGGMVSDRGDGSTGSNDGGSTEPKPGDVALRLVRRHARPRGGQRRRTSRGRADATCDGDHTVDEALVGRDVEGERERARHRHAEIAQHLAQAVDAGPVEPRAARDDEQPASACARARLEQRRVVAGERDDLDPVPATAQLARGAGGELQLGMAMGQHHAELLAAIGLLGAHGPRKTITHDRSTGAPLRPSSVYRVCQLPRRKRTK